MPLPTELLNSQKTGDSRFLVYLPGAKIKTMNLFYRNISITLLIGIGFFLFLHYAGTLSEAPVFSHPLAGKILKSAVNYVLIACGVVILVCWFNEAGKKAREKGISFLSALWAVFLDMGEARQRRHEAFYESIPKPLKKPLPNGLFWLLWTIIVGTGLVFYLAWWGKSNL